MYNLSNSNAYRYSREIAVDFIKMLYTVNAHQGGTRCILTLKIDIMIYYKENISDKLYNVYIIYLKKVSDNIH
jgi:hypothetical protein